MPEGQMNGRDWWGVVLPSGEEASPRRLLFRDAHSAEPLPGSIPGDHDLSETGIDRAAKLVDSKRLIAVLGHGGQARLRMNADTGCVVLEEPASRGTCPSVFLATTYIMARAPEATALIFPLDVTPLGSGHLVKAAERAACLVDRFGERLVMLAGESDWSHSDSGWVETGPALRDCPGGELLAVRRFCENPGPRDTERFLKRGYLLGAGVLAFKVRTLWDLGRELFPEMMKRFESLHDVCKLVMAGKANPELEKLALRDVYRGLETMNFARRVLHRTPDRIALLPVHSGVAKECGSRSRPSAEVDRTPGPPTRLRLA